MKWFICIIRFAIVRKKLKQNTDSSSRVDQKRNLSRFINGTDDAARRIFKNIRRQCLAQKFPIKGMEVAISNQPVVLPVFQLARDVSRM